MYTGKIISFFENRNFGFIDCPEIQIRTGDPKRNHIFFHGSSADFQPKLGDVVTFELAPPAVLGKGPCAVKIQFVESTYNLEEVLKSLAGGR